MSKYNTQADRMVAAIAALAADPDLMINFRHYISEHGEQWYNHYCADLDGLISELEQFATPALPF